MAFSFPPFACDAVTNQTKMLGSAMQRILETCEERKDLVKAAKWKCMS